MASGGGCRRRIGRQRRFTAPCVDFGGGEEEGQMADFLDISAPLREAWSGGGGQRPWRLLGARVQKRRGRRERAKGVGNRRGRKRRGRRGVLFSRPEGRRRHASLWASGDDGSSTELLHCSSKTTTRVGGLGLCWAAICCAARQIREVREGIGQNRPRAWKVYFFLSKVFSISVFKKILCYFIRRVCRFKIVYENLKLFSLLHNK
jgi:hypothetical protein